MKQVFEEQKILDKPFIVVNGPAARARSPSTCSLAPGDPHVLALNTHGYLASFIGGSLDVLPHRDFTQLAVLLDETVAVAVRRLAAEERERPGRGAQARSASQRIAVATSVGNHIHVGVAKPLQRPASIIGKLTVVPFKSSADSIVALSAATSRWSPRPRRT
jgi:putative tricarboxylic transport membrane protein